MMTLSCSHGDYFLLRTLGVSTLLTILVFNPVTANGNNNIEFLDKEIITSLRSSVVEVVVPKIESPKIQYARELPFEKLSFKERNEKYFSIGTAFFINDRELLTAAHVLNLEYFSLLNDFYIRDAKGRTYKIGTIKKLSSRRDMVVFELEDYPGTILPLTFSQDVEIGDTVFSVGNAQGEGISFRAGQVASFTPEREQGLWNDIRFTSPASPGNSGGPLLNVDGKVVGVIIQKNNSENYNVAVPIAETENLKQVAEFYIRNISISLNDEQNTFSMNWREDIALPDTVQNVAKKAQASLNAFYENVSSEAYKKFEDDYFPKGKRFRAYLRNQVNIRQFGVLRSDPDFNQWSLSSYATRSTPIAEDQTITLSKSDLTTGHVIVEKPKDLPLKDFLESPKLVMDTLLKVLPLTRTIEVDKIRLVSLGEPEKTEIWEDQLGRRWISSLWYLPHINYFAYNHCLAYPKGVICNIDIKKAWELKAGYLNGIKQNLNEVAVGYEGDLYDWVEYLSLDKHYLPLVFQASRIDLGPESVQISLNDFKVNLQSQVANETTNLHFHFGYSNQSLLEEELLLFELFPQKGDGTNYRIQKFFSPSTFSSDEYKSQWNEITSKSGDYSEKTVVGNKYQTIQKVISEEEKDFLSVTGDTITREFVIGCVHKLSEDNAPAKCEEFVQSVSFPDQNQPPRGQSEVARN